MYRESVHIHIHATSNRPNGNKSAQSNLARGPCRSESLPCGGLITTAKAAAIPRTMHPKPQLRRSMHFRTATPQTPHWLQWGATNSPPPNYFFPWIDPQTTICLIPGAARPTIPNRIHIRSVVFFTMHCTDRHHFAVTHGALGLYGVMVTFLVPTVPQLQRVNKRSNADAVRAAHSTRTRVIR